MHVTDPPRVRVADLADGVTGVGSVTSLDDTGQVRDPLVLVDLDSAAPPEVVTRAAGCARGGGRLFVGVTSQQPPETLRPLLAALDMTLVPAAGEETAGGGRGIAAGFRAQGTVAVPRECVAVGDPWAEAEALMAAVASVPQAAVVLGQVLRASEMLPVSAALDVESFAYSTLLGGAEFRRWLGRRGEHSLPGPAAEPVLVRRDGDRLTVTLNRPERRNAYGRQLRDALADGLRVALLDPGVGRVVLDGAGSCFCSGGDLAEFGTAPDPVTAHFVRTLAGAGLLVHQLRDRTEVRVHGPCVGAGVELPAFAGTVVAAEGTTFALPEAGMGLIPGAGGTVSLPRRIGRWRTCYLALTGGPLDTSTALAWSLVDQVRPTARPDR